jgi:N-acyl-D-amino-acid deacylase
MDHAHGFLKLVNEARVNVKEIPPDVAKERLEANPKAVLLDVREERLLSIEEAVHKMTGLTAEHLGFADRGVIRVGAYADLVLFDPTTVGDNATPQAADLLSDGIIAVWVAGEMVYESGKVSGARPGKIIRR